MRPTRLEVAGDWSLAFPERDRLKFVAVVKGMCWIKTPARGRERLPAGDVCLIGCTAHTVASDPELQAVDGLSLIDCAGPLSLRLGGDDTVMLGGTEMTQSEIGSATVAVRLAEVLLVEAIRACMGGAARAGWLDALADPRLGRVLALVHDDIAEPWTVARLAAEAGMSRSAFSALFTRMVGQPPLASVRSWRLVRARAMLDQDEANVARVAIGVGYASQSAFGHAFRRAFATTPRGVHLSTP